MGVKLRYITLKVKFEKDNTRKSSMNWSTKCVSNFRRYTNHTGLTRVIYLFILYIFIQNAYANKKVFKKKG